MVRQSFVTVILFTLFMQGSVRHGIISCLMEGQMIWRSYEKLDPSPHEQTLGGNLDNIQGVTHDDAFWYFSTEHQLVKLAHKKNIDDIKLDEVLKRVFIPRKLWRKGYDHFGDIDYFQGRIHVPLSHGARLLPPLMLVYNRDLELQKTVEFPKEIQRHAPWVAVHPITKRIYSSAGELNRLHVYQSGGQRLVYLYDVELSFRMMPENQSDWWDKLYNQGAAFSPQGNFYYVVDHGTDDHSSYTGIHMFYIDEENKQGVERNFIPVKLNNSFDPLGIETSIRDDELEGISIWDLDDSGGGYGQIHLLLLDNDLIDDEFSLLHFRVDRPDLL